MHLFVVIGWGYYLIKMTKAVDIKSALDVLVAKGVINSPQYWLNNCVAGKIVNPVYVRQLIVNAVNKLIL